MPATPPDPATAPARPARSLPDTPEPAAGGIRGTGTGDGAGRPRRVRIVPDGPILIEGPVEIELDDGRTVISDRFLVALCQCRRSRSHPFCDTSHRRRARPPAD